MANYAYINNNSTNNASASTMLPPTANPSYQAFLDQLIRNSDLIMLDTSTVMKGEVFEAMMRQVIPILQKYQKQIVVLQSVLKEIRKLAASTDEQVHSNATRALEGLNALSYANVICYRGNPNETGIGGKESILRHTMKTVWDQNVLILSQAADLATDCRFFQQIRSTKLQHTVQVKRLSNQYGQLKDFVFDTDQDGTATPARPIPTTPAPANNALDLLKRFGM